MIKFNIPLVTGKEQLHIKQAIESYHLCGDGEYTKKCNTWIEKELKARKAMLTTSCTHALEMAAILIDIKHGDEVIMPSYTFMSTVNAFVLRGARIVFVDIRKDTMNLDESLIEVAITKRTKAIVPVHYAGVSCDMDAIMDIAKKHNLYVIEDAAQGVMSTYKNKALGTIGHIGCFSFHETKNYTMGEGGAIIINDERLTQRAEIIRENGTNRSLFFKGMVESYSWVDVGSSYLPSELNAAYLYPQLIQAHRINENRLRTWEIYNSLLQPLKDAGKIQLPFIPTDCEHNGHMYYIKCKDITQRTALIEHLKKKDIAAVFHYIPLHSSKAGLKFSVFSGEDKYTTIESERLLRLPMYYNMESDSVRAVCDGISEFYAC